MCVIMFRTQLAYPAQITATKKPCPTHLRSAKRLRLAVLQQNTGGVQNLKVFKVYGKLVLEHPRVSKTRYTVHRMLVNDSACQRR